ncbi:MAG: UDP-N-acetylmuramoyl-L-alanine--D-glutamate ligase, partial [Veillonella sp.]|nr:UDP-N-acetylmuramoyl-L-alanine--D-glutamate ligase [Veillonella sp.]
MNYSGKHILIIGAGTSGIGAAHVVGQLGGHAILNDYKEIELDPQVQSKLEAQGVTIITGRQDDSLLEGIDRIIVSPGLPLTIPILESARQKGISIVGEV